MTFERTHDTALVREILTHPTVWPWISDDYAGTREAFQPSTTGAVAYVLVRTEAGEVLGLFIVCPRSTVMAEVHTCLLPAARGKAPQIYAQGLDWLWKATSVRRVMGYIRATNKLAIRAAERAGLTRIGVNQRCVQINGALLDQVIYGISAPEGI